MSDYFLCPTQALWEKVVGPFKKGWKTNGKCFGRVAAFFLKGSWPPLYSRSSGSVNWQSGNWIRGHDSAL